MLLMCAHCCNDHVVIILLYIPILLYTSSCHTQIYFLLVRIKIKHMELAIVRREAAGTGTNIYNESETIVKYEVMDGAPVKGKKEPVTKLQLVALVFISVCACCWCIRVAYSGCIKYCVHVEHNLYNRRSFNAVFQIKSTYIEHSLMLLCIIDNAAYKTVLYMSMMIFTICNVANSNNLYNHSIADASIIMLLSFCSACRRVRSSTGLSEAI